MCLLMCLCVVFVVYCEMLYGVCSVFLCACVCVYVFVFLFVIDGVMLHGSFIACVVLLCLCVRVRVVFKACVDIVCDVLRGVVGFRVRACCVVFVRVFCD